MAKRKAPAATTPATAAPTANSPSGILAFFRPSTGQVENKASAITKTSSSSSVHAFTTTPKPKPSAKRKVSVSVLGTTPDNAVVIDDSSDDDGDARTVTPSPATKKPRLSGPAAAAAPIIVDEIIDLNSSQPEPPAVTSLTAKSDKLLADTWDDNAIIDLDFDEDGEDAAFGDPELALLDDEDAVELLDDPDAILDEEAETQAGMESCPVCNIVFENGENPQQHVNRCLDGLISSSTPGAGSSSSKAHLVASTSTASIPPVACTPPPSLPSPSNFRPVAHPPSSTKGKERALPSPSPAPPTTTAPSDAIEEKGKENIFSILMSSHRENMAWKQAELDHARAGTKADKERLARQRKVAAQQSASSSAAVKGKGKRASTVVGEEDDEEGVQGDGDDDDDEVVDPKTGGRGRRLAPFYKVMTGMPVAVDAFRYGKIPGVEAYLLSHFHSDHYTNLSERWKNGMIYCSKTTAELVTSVLKVDPKWVHALPMDEPSILPNTEITCTLIEANHCPGSVLFLLEGRQTILAGDSAPSSKYKSPFIGSNRIFRYLHCGDFRACPQHVLHPAIRGKKLDLIYLDTTYLNPKYCFPPQRQVIDACADLAKSYVLGSSSSVSSLAASSFFGGVKKEEDVKKEEEEAASSSSKAGGGGMLSGWFKSSGGGVKKEEEGEEKKDVKDRILVVVGTYSIGKERIVKGIANALGSKIYVDARKWRMLQAQEDPSLHALLTRDPYAASVHLTPLGALNSDKIGDYLAQWKGHFSRVLAFRPTGWTYTPGKGTEENVNMTPALGPLIAKQQARQFTAANLQPMRNSTRKCMLYGVPYSEHSSFVELSCFALSCEWGRIIATVNVGSEVGRGRMNRWFEKWAVERKKRKERGEADVVSYRDVEYW